jgi:hypothetical protein
MSTHEVIMNMGYMFHLVQTKNDLNRKRRRFHAIMRGIHHYIQLHERDRRAEKVKDHGWGKYITLVTMHPAYSKMQAKRGYERTKQEMKSMTEHMREVRKCLKAKYIWDDRGAIHSVVVEGKRYYEKDIKRLALSYIAESILLN